MLDTNPAVVAEWVRNPKSEPTLELMSRPAISVEAYNRSVCPDAGRNFRGRWMKQMFDTIMSCLKRYK